MATSAIPFDSVLREHHLPPLQRGQITTVQINVGKVCNQACRHCHVDAGPKRTEIMTAETADRILELLQASSGITTVDMTGGAPELNPHFRRLVEESRKLRLGVIDRCNLTILLEPGFADLAEFLAAHGVEVTASLPCYTRENVDQQRGRGVFEKSIRALQLLNRLGYGRKPQLKLNLVFNPSGASLPGPQEKLEADYKRRLSEDFGIEFNRLFTITNMPISRFSDYLVRIGAYQSYSNLLIGKFNAGTVANLMCRSQISVGWNGQLYDCDFNQMLELSVRTQQNIWQIRSFDEFNAKRIVTGSHCFGCTAGAGSSCGGALTSS